MTHEDFIVKYLQLLKENYPKKTAYLLGGILDTSKDGYVIKGNWGDCTSFILFET
jgi:hypothetical protein